MDFAAWITRKFVEWQAEQGTRKTLNDFAAYLGVSRPLLNMWMNGTKPRPGPENIRVLAEVYGDEIYDVLGMPRPDPYLKSINDRWSQIPPEKQHKLAQDAAKYAGETDEKEDRRSKRPKAQTDP